MMKGTFYMRGHGVVEWLTEDYYNVELDVYYMSLKLLCSGPGSFLAKSKELYGTKPPIYGGLKYL